LRQKETNPSRRFIYGYSLGGALAIDLAARHTDIAGVIAESTFTRIADVVKESRYGWVPFVSQLITQNFDSIDKIGRVTVPLLLIHGTADTLIPHTMSDQLYAAATGVPEATRRIVKIEGAGHRAAAISGGAKFAAALHEFTTTASTAASAR
jgi:pimeloyl-ACP methyl ester carboxylesterase